MTPRVGGSAAISSPKLNRGVPELRGADRSCRRGAPGRVFVDAASEVRQRGAAWIGDHTTRDSAPIRTCCRPRSPRSSTIRIENSRPKRGREDPLAAWLCDRLAPARGHRTRGGPDARGVPLRTLTSSARRRRDRRGAVGLAVSYAPWARGKSSERGAPAPGASISGRAGFGPGDGARRDAPARRPSGPHCPCPNENAGFPSNAQRCSVLMKSTPASSSRASRSTTSRCVTSAPSCSGWKRQRQ